MTVTVGPGTTTIAAEASANSPSVPASITAAAS